MALSEMWESVKTEFKEWYRDNEKNFLIAKDLYTSLVTSILSDRDEFSNPQIESRVKEFSSCCKKFERKYQNDTKEELTREKVSEKITDLIGIRVICSYEDEIEKIADVIKENFKVIGTTDKTSELKENEFGYKGLHLDIELLDNRKSLAEYKKISDYRVEIQIRTQIQHAWSFLDHKLKYKHDDGLNYELKRSVNRLAALFELADKEFLRIRDEIKKNALAAIENAEKQEPSTQENGYSNPSLGFVTFSEFMKKNNSEYPFYEERLNSIFFEIKHQNINFSIQNLTAAFAEKNEVIEQYKQKNVWVRTMNPYTTLRHILYAYDKENFANMLNPIQRENFDAFLEQPEIEGQRD